MATVLEIKDYLGKLSEKKVLGNVYGIYGQEPKLYFKLAKEFASFLETGKWDNAEVFLIDAKFIDGEKTKMGVDEARSFAEFLYRMPAQSPRRTLVIHNAEDFTDEAQNALLKICEEPPENSLIIFTMRSSGSLAGTLGSRIQKIYCSSIDKNSELTEMEERAKDLVEKFLMSSVTDRSKLIKMIVEEDSEIRDAMPKVKRAGIVHDEFIVEVFVRELIAELGKNPEKNQKVIKELLKRQSLMVDLNTSRKMQLEAVSQLIGP
jgi:DNA polymerase III delta prime subunit